MRDLWIEDGKIVSCERSSDFSRSAEIIDATGLVVMPGGVDIHCHVAGGKVNAGRKLRPEDHREHVRARGTSTRSGSGYSVPSTYLTGYLCSIACTG